MREVRVTEVLEVLPHTTSPTPGGVSVKCAVCGHEYVHVVYMREVPGNDNYAAGWWGRGNLNVIGFEGECGHEFEVCFGFHKGNVHVFGRVSVERTP